MTIDERCARIERVTAGVAEERSKDREELRGLWRDTQRQLDQLTGRVDAIATHFDTFIHETAHTRPRNRQALPGNGRAHR